MTQGRYPEPAVSSAEENSTARAREIKGECSCETERALHSQHARNCTFCPSFQKENTQGVPLLAFTGFFLFFRYLGNRCALQGKRMEARRLFCIKNAFIIISTYQQNLLVLLCQNSFFDTVYRIRLHRQTEMLPLMWLVTNHKGNCPKQRWMGHSVREPRRRKTAGRTEAAARARP